MRPRPGVLGRKLLGKKVNDIQLLAIVSLDYHWPGSSPVIFFHVTPQCTRTSSTFMIFPPARMFAALFLGPHPIKITFFQHQLFINPEVPGFPNLNCPCTAAKYMTSLLCFICGFLSCLLNGGFRTCPFCLPRCY